MRILATDISQKTLAFTCSIGSGIGTCHEQNIIAGNPCDVEIDIDADLELGLNVEKSNVDAQYWKNNNEVNHISALVESIDEDDTLCLRLADDCIILTYYAKSDITPGDFLLITIGKKDLRITLIGN